MQGHGHSRVLPAATGVGVLPPGLRPGVVPPPGMNSFRTLTSPFLYLQGIMHGQKEGQKQVRYAILRRLQCYPAVKHQQDWLRKVHRSRHNSNNNVRRCACRPMDSSTASPTPSGRLQRLMGAFRQQYANHA